MSNAFAILLMIFFHIVADYNLQGWLASAKQKYYWEENAPDDLYKHDHICALITHSLAWSFMIMLPIAYVWQFEINFGFVIILLVNTALHALVDHAKANWKQINLWQDQLVHLCQILVTSALLFV